MRPTHERVREVLSYDPETGVFTWLVRTSTRVRVGDVAGTPTSEGYWAIRLDHRLYKAHVLAWFWVSGAWPTQEIDHIDGDTLNNRFVNLRDEPKSVNQYNVVAPRCNNSSGYLGVSPHRQTGKWMAQIRPPGAKRKYLGLFDTPEAAHAAYMQAKAELHGVETYQGRLV